MGWPIGRKMAWSYNKHLRRPENHFKPKADFKAERVKSKFMQHPSSMFHYFIFTVAFTRWTHWTATQTLPPPRTRCPSHKVLGFHIVKHAHKNHYLWFIWPLLIIRDPQIKAHYALSTPTVQPGTRVCPHGAWFKQRKTLREDLHKSKGTSQRLVLKPCPSNCSFNQHTETFGEFLDVIINSTTFVKTWSALTFRGKHT